MNNNLMIFENPEFGAVRSILIDGDPWFVAADVCKALEIEKTNRALSRLDDDEKGAHSVSTPGGRQRMSIISESGLYSLILGSRKPEARAFKRWITQTATCMWRRPSRTAGTTPCARSSCGQRAGTRRMISISTMRRNKGI